MKETVDALDKGIIAQLSEDGGRSKAEMAGRLGVSNPTIRSRVRSLLERGTLRLAGVVDASAVGGLTTALVGVTLVEFNLDEQLEQLAALEEVAWAAVVTGRYDLVVEVVTADGMSGLYDFLNVSLQEIGGVRSSEMFVVMKSRRKWVDLPAGLRREWAAARAGQG